MRNATRSVTVRRLPAKLDGKVVRRLFAELESSINTDRPAVVFDCSDLRELDRTAILFLLSCLEGAMKRNGDVRLCGVTPRGRLSMELAGIDRLFRSFATSHEAVASYHGRAAVAPVRTAAFALERAA